VIAVEKRCVSISLFTKGLDLIVVLQFQDEEMSFAENLSFASIEVVPERFIQKDNYHGIGYNPLNPTAALHTKVKQSTSVKGRTKTGSRLSFMGQVIMIAYLFILRQFYSSRQPDRSRFVASPRAYNQDRPQRPKHRSTATKITIEA